MVDGHRVSSHSIDNGVLQGSDTPIILFLFVINDQLNQTSCPIHSYAETFPCSFRGDQPFEMSTAHSTERVTSDLSEVSDWFR